MGSFNQKLKIYGVASLRTDIIFMSDIRLCNAQGVPSSNEISQAFRINPYGAYNFFHNSHSNKRGVGILIKNNPSFTVSREWRDRDDNILGLQLSHSGVAFNLVAIYGPNKVQPSFFDNLRICIQELGNHPLIMGGDWNCTYSMANLDSNIDVLNMQNLPNLSHSKLLKKMCNDLNLCDPFRTRYPNRADYTYVPSNTVRKNRSRIDFFIVTNNLMDKISSIGIKYALQNKSFDHKAIMLSFAPPPKVIKQPSISKSILTDPDLDRVIGLAIADTYLIHTLSVNDALKDVLLRSVGVAKNTLRACGPDHIHLPPGHRSEFQENLRAGQLATVDELLDSIPFRLLQEGDLQDGILPDIFMETLVNNIRNETISHQIFIKKVTAQTVEKIEMELKDLKLNYNQNSKKIFDLENSTLKKSLIWKTL